MRNSRNISINDKFGHLTIIGIDEKKSNDTKKKYYFVKCDCGSPIKSVSKSSLLNKTHPTISCGCMRGRHHSLREKNPIKNGTKFGKLTILEKDINKSITKNKPYYFVKCDCGSPIKSVLKATLFDKRHPLQSCGCLVKEKAGFQKDRDYALAKLLYLKTKERHINTLKCSGTNLIEFDDFYKKIKKPCYYCGKENTSYITDRRTGYKFFYNGLDRIDSSLGYTKENTVSACKWCNISKGEMTIDEFKEYITRLYIKNYETQ